MSYDKEKLSRFEKTVLAQAEEKIQKIRSEIKEYEKSELEKTKQQEYDRIFTYMQTQVHNLEWKYKRIVTKKSLEAQREILVCRNELIEKVFEQTKEKLLRFAESAEYKIYLIKRLGKAAETFSCKDAEISVRAQDMQFEEDILRATGAAIVSVDKSNKLGGFKIINNKDGLLLDETLDSDLIEQRQYFYQTCGMTVAD